MGEERKASTQALTLAVPKAIYRRIEAKAAQQGAEIEAVALSSLLRGLSEKDSEPDWARNPLLRLPAVDLGMTDAGEEHDHYIYGTPKRRGGKAEEAESA